MDILSWTFPFVNHFTVSKLSLRRKLDFRRSLESGLRSSPPPRFVQARFSLVEINNAKLTRPAVASRDERGLIFPTSGWQSSLSKTHTSDSSQDPSHMYMLGSDPAAFRAFYFFPAILII